MVQGKLYFITGLPGAGKTTVANALFQKLRQNQINIVHLDGDRIREILNMNNKGYSIKERKKLSFQYVYFAKLLLDQNIDVILSTVSMFHEVRDWNRKNLNNYFEIFLEVDIKILVERDQKGIYQRALFGQDKHVLGINMNYEIPDSPTIILKNNGENTPDQLVNIIIKAVENYT